MTARDRSEASLASQSDDLDRELKEGLGPPDERFGLRSRYQRDAVQTTLRATRTPEHWLAAPALPRQQPGLRPLRAR